MIKTIKEIWIRNVDEQTSCWSQLPIVAGTATLKIEITNEEAGRIKTYDLSMALWRQHPDAGRNLRICVIFDCDTIYFGTQDLPVRLDFQEENRLTASTKYRTRADY